MWLHPNEQQQAHRSRTDVGVFARCLIPTHLYYPWCSHGNNSISMCVFVHIEVLFSFYQKNEKPFKCLNRTMNRFWITNVWKFKYKRSLFPVFIVTLWISRFVTLNPYKNLGVIRRKVKIRGNKIKFPLNLFTYKDLSLVWFLVITWFSIHPIEYWCTSKKRQSKLKHIVPQVIVQLKHLKLSFLSCFSLVFSIPLIVRT